MKKLIAVEICVVIALAVGFWLGRITSPYNDYAHYYDNADKAWFNVQEMDTPPISFDEPDKNRLRKVRAAYRAVFDNYPDSRWADDAIYQLASRLPRTDEEGFALFRRLIRDYPDSEYADDSMYAVAIATYRIAEEFKKTGTLESPTAYYDRALTLFNQIIAIYPGSVLQEEAQYSAAMCYYGSGDVNTALSELENLKIEFSNHPISYKIRYMLGLIYLEQQDYEDAKKEFLNVIDSGDPKYGPLASFYIANIYFNEGNKIEFEANFKEEQGKLQEAEAEKDEAMKKYQESVDGYQRVIDLYSDTKVGQDALFYIALPLEKLKTYDDAITRLEAAIEAYPDNENASNSKYYIGQLAYLNNDTAKAIEVFQEFADDLSHTYDDRLQAQYQVGYIYEKDIEDLEQAIDAYEKLISDYPEPHKNPSHPSRSITENYVQQLKAEFLDEAIE